MLIAATPALAWAATEQHALRTTTLDSMSVFVWAAIVFFSLIGWAVNDLDHIAELWKDGENAYEKWKERMKLSKGVIASFAAGIFTYFICKTAPGPILGMAGLKPIDGHPIEIPEMIIFILVTGGAYMGTRWFAAVERKLTGKSKDDAAP
jgi:amino acid transporter